jgi:hypothetical protein
MATKESESGGNNDEGGFTSIGVVDIVFDAPCDRTVRPLRESLRKVLEERGIIPRRPLAPETPPAPPEQPPS